MEQVSRPRFAALAEAPVAAAIVAVNVLALVAVIWWFDLPWASWKFDAAIGTRTLLAAGGLERGLVWSGQWWRLLTAVFLHGGLIHLLANSLFGFGWCRVVERMLGHGRFLALYLLAGIGASATSLVAHDVTSVGASGALFGMIGATLVIHRRLLPGWGPFLKSRMTLSVAGQLTLWTVLALSYDLPLDHAAHGGGLVAGALITWTMTRPAPRRAVAWWPVGLLLGSLLAAAVWPRTGPTAYQHVEAIEAAWTTAQAAIRSEDAFALTRSLGALDALQVPSEDLEYLRAVEAYLGGDLERAAALAERVLKDPKRPRDHPLAALLLANIGARHYDGEGVPRDVVRGRALIREACEAGLEQACRIERALGSGEPAPP
jgi:membrane associated rhomboid family serine protease